MTNLTVEALNTLLLNCSPRARILICTNSPQKKTSSDDGIEVIELVEHRTYAIEGEANEPEVIIHFEIPEWKTLGLRVLSQSQDGRFVETVYE